MQACCVGVTGFHPRGQHALANQRLAPGFGLLAGQADAQGGVQVQPAGQQVEPGGLGLGEFRQVQLAGVLELAQQGGRSG